MTENGEKSPFFIYFEYIKNTIRILYSATTTHIVFYLFVFFADFENPFKNPPCKNCNIATEKCGSLTNSIVIFARV